MKARRKRTRKTPRGKHVVVIGLGNIGSPLTDMLARTAAIGRLTLIDQDVYEQRNLMGQSIWPSDIGKPKAVALADHVREVRPEVRIRAFHAALKDVPPAQLRADAILTGLDSKLSRQQVNQLAWHLGVPWIDAGVNPDGRLARVTVYVPGTDQPCLECAWDSNDYDALAVRRPCQAEASAAPTAAPAFLGSLAAAFEMTECEKILDGDRNSVAAGKQITIAAATHKHYVTTLRRNPRCRFDHQTYRTEPMTIDLPSTSLDALMAELSSNTTAGIPLRFQVEGKSFLRELRCACGEQKPVFHLEGRLSAQDRACARCHSEMEGVGFSMMPLVSESDLPADDRRRALGAIGFLAGDLITIKTPTGVNAFELRPK